MSCNRIRPTNLNKNNYISTAQQIAEVSNSEKRHVVNIGNHADLRLQKYAITQSNDSTLLIISISPNRADVSFSSFSQKHRAWSNERSRVFQRTKIKRVHNSHKPLESHTLIYWHNKSYFFLFRPKINPVLWYEKARRNADRRVVPALQTVRGADAGSRRHGDNNKHLTTGPKGNSEFCFSRILMFPKTKSRETLRFEGNKIHCWIPKGPVIKWFVI